MNYIDDKDFREFKGKIESSHIVGFDYFRDKVKQRLTDGVSHFGDKLPWKKSYDLVRLRPGEVSLWAGVNGHGKSLVVGQVMLWLPPTSKILIASLEMPGDATVARMCQQTMVSGIPTDQYADHFMDVTNNMWIYDVTGTVSQDRIIPMLYYAAEKLQMNHIVIDSLMKCGINPPDENSKQKNFINQLCSIARDYDCHIHLVHHMKKGEKETQEPDKWHIRGAGELTDMADNVFIHHRCKDKEKKVEDGQEVGEFEPDAKLYCVKQRHGEWEGKFALYFDQTSHQFMSGPESRLRWRE